MDYTTAVALILPGDHSIKVNSIREKYDKAYERWMPHINFMYPFFPVDDFDGVHEKLQEAFKEFTSFDLEFDDIGYFVQKTRDKKKIATYHMCVKDDNKLQEIFKILTSVLPEVKVRKVFRPHLTLGQCPRADADTVVEDVKELLFLEKKMVVHIDGIYMINRSKDDNSVPFSVNKHIQFC
jgi:2'-5' RNA ligase